MPFVDQKPAVCRRCRGLLVLESRGERWNARQPEYACTSCGERYYVGQAPNLEDEADKTRRRQPTARGVRL
jgi:hypothetical protein